jgi:hypothetical protein
MVSTTVGETGVSDITTDVTHFVEVTTIASLTTTTPLLFLAMMVN